jgi:hypothetical protein
MAHDEAEQFIVESSLVAYGPGLEIRKIIPGYELCRIILQLPIDTRKEDIQDLFLQQGLASFDFVVLKIESDKESVRATVVIEMQHGKKRIVEELRKRDVSFEVRHDAIWTSGTTSKPSLTVTWDTSLSERRMTRSSSAPSVSFSTVYQMLCDSQGARMKTCYLLDPDITGSMLDREALTLEFDTWENARKTARKIKAKRIPSIECNVPRPYSYSTQVPFAQYEIQKKQWLDLTKRKKKQRACVTIDITGEELVSIRVEGDNRKHIGELNTRIEELARGELLEGTYWHPSFASSKDSATFFKRLADNTAVHLRCDSDIQALRLYGEPSGVEQARRMIENEVREREQVVTKTRLTGPSVAFFKKEGFGKLQELIGEDKVDLKVTPKRAMIMVPGREDATHHFRRLLAESAVGTGHTTGEPTCPVCLNEAAYPERLSCGHAYCPGCLNSLLTAVMDSKRFPIVCIGNDATCNAPIALPFIRLFLPQYTFKRLLEAAFTSYLEQNPMQFQHCQTSGCRQTHRLQTSKAVVVSCPSCLVEKCSRCGAEHVGITCEEHQSRKEERQFIELARTKGYRRCPHCEVLVEKNGGCDNMFCRCQKFVSWLQFRTVR